MDRCEVFGANSILPFTSLRLSVLLGSPHIVAHMSCAKVNGSNTRDSLTEAKLFDGAVALVYEDTSTNEAGHLIEVSIWFWSKPKHRPWLTSHAINGSPPARFIRVIGLGGTSNDWNSLTEIQLFVLYLPKQISIFPKHGLWSLGIF